MRQDSILNNLVYPKHYQTMLIDKPAKVHKFGAPLMLIAGLGLASERAFA